MTEKKSNNFVRAMIVGLCGFIIWLVAYSFLSLEPKGSISTGVITLVALLVVIVLSEIFDNFSVAKVLTMSRGLKDKDQSIGQLNTENSELRRELVNVVTSISQNQSSTNIIGFPDDFKRRMGVEKASEDEISKKRTEEHEDSEEPVKPSRKRINHHKLEELAFSKFLEQRNLTNFDLIQEAKLVSQFSGIDAISNNHPIYDGYINTGDSEIFIEVKVSRASSAMMRDRMYLMLNKIYLYNKVKGANAHLNLLLVDVGGENVDEQRKQRSSDKLKEFFEPSIVNGLLKIIPIEFTDEDVTLLYREE